MGGGGNKKSVEGVIRDSKSTQMGQNDAMVSFEIGRIRGTLEAV